MTPQLSPIPEHLLLPLAYAALAVALEPPIQQGKWSRCAQVRWSTINSIRWLLRENGYDIDGLLKAEKRQ